MDKTTIKPGTVVGRWTVLNDYTKNAKGEKKWLCRCECGTERYVLERALKSDGSLSCGCLRKQRIYEAVAHDVLGKTFGDLTVVGKSKRRTKHGTYWTCLCTCGYTCEATASELVSGSKTNCGCKRVKNYTSEDITGLRFGRLVALYRTEKRDKKGSVIWHCRCDCGNEVDVSYNAMVYAESRFSIMQQGGLDENSEPPFSDCAGMMVTWSTDLLTGSSLWLIIIKATPRKRSVQT